MWLFILISDFIILVFRFQKSLGKPKFGFDFLATVWFGFLKTETEPTFQLPHIARVNLEIFHTKTTPDGGRQAGRLPSICNLGFRLFFG